MDIEIPALQDYQQNFHEQAMARRWNAIAGGRRSGKSFYAIIWLLVGGLMGTREACSVWLSPTIKQARNVGLNGFMSSVRGFPKEIVDLKLGELKVTIAGYPFYFMSTDNADSIRGLPVKRVVLDEVAFQQEYAWTNVVRPALADHQGWALFCSTYNGFNWFYDVMQQETWNRVTWPTSLNPRIKPEEIEEMRETMDEQAYKQEVLAIPTTRSGLVFENVFSEESLVENHGPRPGDLQAIAFDFGYADPTAVSFYTYHWESATRCNVVKYDEMECRGELLEAIIPQVVDRLMGWGVDPVDLACAVDIAGKQHTGVSEWSYIERLRAANIFNIKYRKVEKESAINFLRSQFLNANNYRGFKICKRCRKSIESYTAYELKKNERPFDDAKHDHFPDSDTYFYENLIRPSMGGKEPVERMTGKNKGRAEMRTCECGKRYITFDGASRCKTCVRTAILEV